MSRTKTCLVFQQRRSVRQVMHIQSQVEGQQVRRRRCRPRKTSEVFVHGSQEATRQPYLYFTLLFSFTYQFSSLSLCLQVFHIEIFISFARSSATARHNKSNLFFVMSLRHRFFSVASMQRRRRRIARCSVFVHTTSSGLFLFAIHLLTRSHTTTRA